MSSRREFLKALIPGAAALVFGFEPNAELGACEANQLQAIANYRKQLGLDGLPPGLQQSALNPTDWEKVSNRKIINGLPPELYSHGERLIGMANTLLGERSGMFIPRLDRIEDEYDCFLGCGVGVFNSRTRAVGISQRLQNDSLEHVSVVTVHELAHALDVDNNPGIYPRQILLQVEEAKWRILAQLAKPNIHWAHRNAVEEETFASLEQKIDPENFAFILAGLGFDILYDMKEMPQQTLIPNHLRFQVEEIIKQTIGDEPTITYNHVEEVGRRIMKWNPRVNSPIFGNVSLVRYVELHRKLDLFLDESFADFVAFTLVGHGVTENKYLFSESRRQNAALVLENREIAAGVKQLFEAIRQEPVDIAALRQAISQFDPQLTALRSFETKLEPTVLREQPAAIKVYTEEQFEQLREAYQSYFEDGRIGKLNYSPRERGLLITMLDVRHRIMELGKGNSLLFLDIWDANSVFELLSLQRDTFIALSEEVIFHGKGSQETISQLEENLAEAQKWFDQMLLHKNEVWTKHKPG